MWRPTFDPVPFLALGTGSITKLSVSAWSFSVVIVRKKDGKPCFCPDYRMLNRKMKPDKWPRSNLEENTFQASSFNIFRL